MSRIFDALQRSGSEQSGIEYDDMMTMVADVFEAPRVQSSAAVEDAVSAIPEAMVQTPTPVVLVQNDEDAAAPRFHRVETWPNL